uniref:Uncharacterized LOC100179930 n=1 Tax=Ciona intestinalis TaxID=7719 RepID=F6YM21_CIOIN|nr:uncharacterized protein LOC100179930 [Ciona intestinalis]|eukprot:XP_002126615.1 uncharacterized protein LOC100179930 [Ciona intestinalis]
MSWSWADFIPFYELFFGEELVEAVPEKEIGYFGSLFPDCVTLHETYEQAVEQIRLFQGPDEAEETINRLHLDLCTTVFFATTSFLLIMYAAKTAFRYGKPCLLALSETLAKLSSRNVETKVKKLDTRMNFMENILTETFKHLSVTNVAAASRKELGGLIDKQVNMLTSTKEKLDNISGTIRSMLETPKHTGGDQLSANTDDLPSEGNTGVGSK